MPWEISNRWSSPSTCWDGKKKSTIPPLSGSSPNPSNILSSTLSNQKKYKRRKPWRSSIRSSRPSTPCTKRSFWQDKWGLNISSSARASGDSPLLSSATKTGPQNLSLNTSGVISTKLQSAPTKQSSTKMNSSRWSCGTLGAFCLKFYFKVTNSRQRKQKTKSRTNRSLSKVLASTKGYGKILVPKLKKYFKICWCTTPRNGCLWVFSLVINSWVLKWRNISK